MVVCCLLVTFLLGVNLFDQVSVQAKNVTDNLDEQNENVLQALTSHFKNIIGLKNESYYELECDCGIGSIYCHYNTYGVKICDCGADYAQNNDKCEKCDCGYDAISCHLNGSFKVCTCREGYIAEHGKCERCDCGPNSISCELTFDKYTRCTCVPGYVAQRRTWFVNEYCKLPSVSGWRLAIYVESMLFVLIIIVCTIIICRKRASD
ncbi:uncharacterized protein [Parasteatoda tepidariorum]|uniref:uncharacterized protein isoform X2 n=1 Tax=Parasteatoda tepidariorum TaxID=114398 RepID=UPI001C7288AF|nr:uncharacterized protein LOC107453958 isoform X2 [Parasteatoda tepidariorum]